MTCPQAEEFTAKPISTRGSSQDGATAPETHKTEKEEKSKPDLTTVISREDEETLVTGSDQKRDDGCLHPLGQKISGASSTTLGKNKGPIVRVACP